MTRSSILSIIAVAGLVGAADAHPIKQNSKVNVPRVARGGGNGGGTGGTDGPGWADNFDSYATNSQLLGQGGWEGWPGYVNNNPTCIASNAHAVSAPNSAAYGWRNLSATPPTDESDFVHRYTPTGGRWIYRGMTYFASGATHPVTPGGDPYFILLRNYTGTVNNWSVQVHFVDAGQEGTTGYPPNSVADDNWMGGGTTYPNNVFSPQPLVKDQWVEIRAEIDLDAADGGRVKVYYNNGLVSDHRWHDAPLTMPAPPYTLQAVDLYNAGVDSNFFFVDNLSLTQQSSCYANCDGSTGAVFLTINDFVCFQSAFAAGGSYANCDGSTNTPVLTINDFVCFQSAFAAGCSAP